jgi:hypothetical protein
MVYLNTFNNTLAYVAQSVVLFDDASYVCILATTAPTAPAVNPPPNTATTNWQPLGGKSIFYNAYDETGATPYPPGAVVLSGGVYWYATVAYIPPSPVVALPPINFTTVGWKLLSSTYNEFPILGVPAFLVPPLSNTGLASVQTSTNNTATAPFTDFTNDTGSTGFAGGGVGTPLTPGGRYLVKYNMSFIANIVNVNTSTAQYIVSMTFNQPVVFPAPLSYYQIFDSGVVGAGATPIPSQPISGSFTFLAPPDATYIGIQIENILVSGTGFPADNTNQRCFISFSDINEDPATTTTGLLLTAFG